MQSGSTSTARTVAMVSADGPAPLAPVEDSDGASRTWTIATGLGANWEAGDGPEEVHLAGHRWSWFAGGPRGWRGEFELMVQTKLQKHMHKHMPNAEDEAVNSVHEGVSHALWLHRGNLAALRRRAEHHRNAGAEECRRKCAD